VLALAHCLRTTVTLTHCTVHPNHRLEVMRTACFHEYSFSLAGALFRRMTNYNITHEQGQIGTKLVTVSFSLQTALLRALRRVPKLFYHCSDRAGVRRQGLEVVLQVTYASSGQG
jgi:hypothetical protein